MLGRARGGGGPGGDPSDDGFRDLCGGHQGDDLDMAWQVIESDVYKDKDVALLRLSDIRSRLAGISGMQSRPRCRRLIEPVTTCLLL